MNEAICRVQIYCFSFNSRNMPPNNQPCQPRLLHLKHIHRDFLFSSIPPSPPNKNIPYWSCPLWTPSLTLPPSSLKCLQNSNPSIHRKCFKCFKCFRCFISLLDHKTAWFRSKSEQNPKNRYSPTSAIKWVRKTPKKAIHPLVYEHGSVLQAVGAVFFRQSRLFVLFHPSHPSLPSLTKSSSRYQK